MSQSHVPTEYDSVDLTAWAQAVEAEIAQINSAMLPLQRRLEAAREKIDLIQRLRHLVNGEGGATVPSKAAPRPSSPSTDVEAEIEQILEAAGQPQHITSIRQKLIEQGTPLPGRGDEANIILRLRRAPDRFVRTGRGMYGLTRWNIQAMPPTTRKRRVRRRRKIAA